MFRLQQYNNTGFGGSPHHSFSPNHQPAYNQPSPTPPSTNNYYTPTPPATNALSPNSMMGGVSAPTTQPGYNNPMGGRPNMMPSTQPDSWGNQPNSYNMHQPQPFVPQPNMGVSSQPPSTYFTPQEPINQPLGPPSRQPMPTPSMPNFNIMNPSTPPAHGKKVYSLS